MNILYYDCFAGISGDMNLGALIDLGVPQEYLLSELEKLKVDGYSIHISRELKLGISGTRVDVQLLNDHDHNKPELEKYANHADKHHNHDHSQNHLDQHTHHRQKNEKHEHEHRNLASIKKIIETSALNDFVKVKSVAIFNEIALAEAKVHAKSIDEIHFHEVGAIDSIVDIVGAAICIDYLKPEIIIASTIELGGGFVECAHGTFPVPAPATAEILKNIPVKSGIVNKETTTPTGAAILKVFAEKYTDQLEMEISKVSYGIGHRDLKIPNVLRVYSGKLKQSSEFITSKALMIECNIDDMNPENYSYIIESLFDAGAQDVFLVPVIMKKSRPAVQLSVLCDQNCLHTIEQFILTETTSLGLRYTPVNKSMLERKNRTINTPFGPIRIKEGILKGKVIKYKPEYDDCAAAARKAKVTLNEVYKAVENCVIKDS
jgi:uncharacterized protein (TIGR00299 family) protein